MDCSPRLLVRTAHLLLLAAFVAVLLLFRSGVAAVRPPILAGIGALLIILYAVDATASARRRAYGSVLALCGALVIFGGGMANWLFSLQGYVILTEVDALPLQAAGHLQGFDAGPLSNPGELAAMIQLEKVDLVAAGDGFIPTSHLRVRRDGDVTRLTIAPGQGAELQSLRLRQGVFGFAPRIVVVKADRLLSDKVIPFTTRRTDGKGTRFYGGLTIPEERLEIRAVVDLSGLDDHMRGHPKLAVVVDREGKEIGRGELLPGHYAELRDGYRIGFTALKKWSEIDISRRNYPEPMLAGAALIVLGGIVGIVRRLR